MTKELEQAKELLEANGFEVKEKSKWVDGVLGKIGADANGYPVYEDVVHDLGGGKFTYRIRGTENDGSLVIPERPDIPKKHWGKKVSNNWVQWTIN